ncbi:ABC transporter permease [Paraflavitalea soli]|uniref:ABC transporter permease n=1 Tax=Paraflavitalea soli TaxID=2315862 RepID=A0A3B7MPU1_9BACT|nr:ABC transporter permease [Paraflavitalea soli]AXY76168.1 ABC transporter permease [Paraflavitalea soli]
MFRNYLKIALRSILRHKAYSIINISGLAIGMASSILILLWVQHELSYDKWHQRAARIYRINSAAGDFKTAVTAAGMTEGFQSAMPAIRNTVRLVGPRHSLFSVGDRKFEENKVFYADSSFLDMFSFRLVKGDAKTALQRPDGMLITEEMAARYFGKEDPIGKVVRKSNNRDVVVTGVLANIPSNSHLQFDFMLPMSSPEQRRELTDNPWDNFTFYSYIQLDEHFAATPAALADLAGQMNKVFKQHNTGIKIDFTLQPLTRIHLHSNLQIDLAGGGNVQYVNIFFIVAIFIMVVACINFMNLATARSARRAKEVGLRKVVGAVRRQLIMQFLGEALLISFFSLLVALLVVWLVLPSFNELAGKTLIVNLWDGKLLLTLLGIAVATGLISGSYPALFLSGFRPVKVLKGNLRGLSGNRLFRNTLVVVQFVVSIVLLIGTIVIYNQLRYIKNRNLGYEKENLLCMPMKGELWNKKQALYDALAKDPATDQFTVTSDLPTNTTSGTINVDWPGKDPRLQIVFPSLDVSESYFDIFHMKLLGGRAFSKSFNDSSNYILNETAARTMGMTAASAIGQQITFQDTKGTIVGVVADFNFKPIQRTIEPLVMRLNRWGGIVVVRTKPGATEATIKSLGKISQALEPAYPFAYNFLDQDLANQYKGEQQMGSIFNLFALLAVFISCLGLYGLSAYMAEQRTKEIGVRKVLGASLFNIVRLLSGDFTRLIVIAMVIAIPLARWAVNQWLTSFAYHIQVGWGVFVLAPLAALVIAWITVSYESIKVGVANPVKSLRSE